MFVFKIDPVHSRAVRRVNIVQNPEVSPDTVARIERLHLGFLRQICRVSFEAEGDEPLAGRFLFHRDFFDDCLVGDLAMVADLDISDFGELECRGAATRVLELEAGLRVRHALVVSG